MSEMLLLFSQFKLKPVPSHEGDAPHGVLEQSFHILILLHSVARHFSVVFN